MFRRFQGDHKDCQCSTYGIVWKDNMTTEFAESFYRNVDLYQSFQQQQDSQLAQQEEGTKVDEG